MNPNLNRTTVITSVFLLGLLVACSRENPQEVRTRHIEQEIESAITDIPKALEKGGMEQYAKMLTVKISSLPDKARQREWCRKATDALFNIELWQLKPGRRYNSMSAVDILRGQIGNCWYKAGSDIEEGWDVKLQYLVWFKRQLDWCTAEYAKIEPTTRIGPIPLTVARKARALKNMKSSLTVDYEAACEIYERDFEYNGYKLPAEGWTNVLRKFEAFLGRPVRTTEQIINDRTKAMEARLRAEEAAQSGTNRPPPLILIDGTK